MVALILGIACCVAGAFGRFWVGRRRFNRRNVAGLQEFGSYGGALATASFEKIVGIGAFLLILFGLMLVAMFIFRPQ